MAPGFLGVSHGEWKTPADPPPGDYEAVLIANQAPWRITSATQAWEQIAGLDANRIASPPQLPAVWYAWRGTPPNQHLYKSSNNGTSWTQLASDPFTPDTAAGGIFQYWPDHLIAATQGILLTARWSSVGSPGFLHLKNIFYSLDDGSTWSQVYATDLANGNSSRWGRENLVANTVYTWFVDGSNSVKRISHGGGAASETAIAMPVGSWSTIDMLACDSTLDGQIVYAVAQASGQIGRHILRTSALAPDQFVDVTPLWDLTDSNLGFAWIAVAGGTVMALAYGFSGGLDVSSIWRSENAGLTWSKIRNWSNDVNSFNSTNGYKAVGNSPSRPNTWFVWANNNTSAGSKVLRSSNNGDTWAFVNLPSSDPLGANDQLYYEVRVLG